MTAFFIKLLNMSLTATAVMAVMLLLRALLKKHLPRWGISLLWLVAALALVCPFRPAFPLSVWQTSEPLVSEIPSENRIQTYFDSTPDLFSSAETFAVGDDSVSSVPDGYYDEALDISPDYIFEYQAEIPAERVTPDEDSSPLPQASEPYTASRVEWLYLVSRIWVLGVLVMTVYALVRYAQIKRRAAVSVPFVDGAYLCDAIDTPFVLGFFPPKIYLPSSLAEGDFCPVLAHERAHITRGDPVFKAVGWLILTVHWFHPLVWICYHCFCTDLEFACDERAVKNLCNDERRSYAEALLSCSVGSRRSLALSHPLAFGEIGVRERISSVLTYQKPGVLRSCVPLLLFAMLGGLFLTTPMSDREFVDVLKQNGYTVHKAETYQTLTVTVDKEWFSAYVRDGADVYYEAGEVVVYDCAPTMLSLTEVLAANDPDEYWMNFTFTYTAIPTEGMLTTLLRPEYKDNSVLTWSSIPQLVGDVWDAQTTYPDRADCCYQAEAVTFGILFDREVLENAEEYIAFTIGGLSDVYFSRGDKNPTEDIVVTRGGTVGPNCVELYVNNYDNQPIDLTLALEAFPDASLYADVMHIYSMENDEKNTILAGMPVRNVYLSDLTGDGKPEFCASVYWGSGVIDSHIVVYDYVEKKEYTLWERGTYDYRLEMENHTLYAVMTDFDSRKDLYRDVLMLIPTGDGYALSMGDPSADSVLSDLYSRAESYVSERCIYMSPLSSVLSIGGDTGYRYYIDSVQNSFCEINRDTGRIQMVGSLLGGWKDFPWTDEEFAAMFVIGDEENLTRMLGKYTERKALPLTTDVYLLSMNDELWLMQLCEPSDSEPFVWSIHELIPEADKGFAYYYYVPAMSAQPPYLQITFDLPDDVTISAFCNETGLAGVPADGWVKEWDHSWRNNDGSMQMLWSPTESEESLSGGVKQASITFTAINDDQTRYCAGTIYITRDEDVTDAWDHWYRVTVVGQGLTVSNNDSDSGVLVSWNDN